MRIAVELVRLLSKQGLTSLTPTGIFDYLSNKGIQKDRAVLVSEYLGGSNIDMLATQLDLKPECVRKRLIMVAEKIEKI